jgi:predicted enzyme related to lactoylglutathione lyase
MEQLEHARFAVWGHQIYFFPVTDLERSLSVVQAKGGKTLPPVELPNGARLAGCVDPQGAAFGLYRSARNG